MLLLEVCLGMFFLPNDTKSQDSSWMRSSRFRTNAAFHPISKRVPWFKTKLSDAFLRKVCAVAKEKGDPQWSPKKRSIFGPKKNFTTSGSVGGFWVFFGAGTEDFSRWVFVAVKIWGNQKLDTFSNLFKKIWWPHKKKSQIVYSWRCFFPSTQFENDVCS